MIAIDLYCGLGGWADGLLAENWRVIGFDIEQHVYGEHRYPAQLVIQDVLTLHGAQFRNADLIVASPPCQEYSYMAMPWKRAKAKAAAIRADESGAELERLNRLFNACFRIKGEASEAAGRDIPLIVENVRGAIPWVGRSRWNFGSFHLWGDVPALMPIAKSFKSSGMNWSDQTKRGQDFTRIAGNHAIKNNGDSWFAIGGPNQKMTGQNQNGRKTKGHPNIRDGYSHTRHLTNPGEIAESRKGAGAEWFDANLCTLSSKSPARKFASAMIAKIPLPLSRYIGATFRAERVAA